jgi:hypothetical protein
MRISYRFLCHLYCRTYRTTSASTIKIYRLILGQTDFGPLVSRSDSTGMSTLNPEGYPEDDSGSNTIT